MGGGTIRSAAVLGMTAVTGGLRSIPAEHFTFASGRMPFSGHSVAASVDDVRLVASNLESSGVEKPCLVLDENLAFDDWECVNHEPMLTRVVFGGLPTLQEAKEATSDLSMALEKTYLSPSKSIGYESSSVADQGSGLAHIEDIKTKACVTTETFGVPSLPAPTIRAFKLLHESAKAKDVVASIASDQNVWTAVLQNKELQNFLKSERARLACAGSSYSMEYASDYDCDANNAAEDSGENTESSWFNEFFQKMKCGVINMLSSLSDYFKDLFGGKADGKGADAFMEGSMMGLAVMAILVILLKRT